MDWCGKTLAYIQNFISIIHNPYARHGLLTEMFTQLRYHFNLHADAEFSCLYSNKIFSSHHFIKGVYAEKD